MRNNPRSETAFYLGLSSLIFTTLMVLIAYVVSEGYNPFLKTISKLGIDPIGQYPFVLGTTVGGILLILFHLIYFDIESLKNVNIKRGRIFGMISGLGMFGVGIFQDFDDLFLQISHFAFAGVFFASMTLSILFYGQFLKENENEYKINSFLYKSSLIITLIAVIHLFVSFYEDSWYLGSFEFGISIIWQKFSVLSFLSWNFLVLIFENSLIKEKIASF